MRSLYLILIIILLAISTSNCGKDKATNPIVRVFPSELAGTWNYQSVTINGQAAVMRTILDWQDETVRASLTISSNSTYVYREYSVNDSILYFDDGSFAVNNNNFIITTYNNSNGVVSPPLSNSGTYEISGNQLTLSLNIEENIISIIAAK